MGALAASPDFGKGQGASLVCLQTRGDVASTLRASAGAGDVDTGENVICMASQQSEASVEDDMCPTITAAAGTSGNNQPVICMSDGQADANITHDMTATLNCMHEQPIVCMSSDTSNAAIDEDVAGTLHVGGGLPMIAAELSAPATTRESARTMS